MGNCISSLIWKHWNKYCDYHNLLSILKRKICNVLCTLLVIVQCCWIRTAQPEKVMQDEMPLTRERLQSSGERLHLLLHATETSGKALLALVARCQSLELLIFCSVAEGRDMTLDNQHDNKSSSWVKTARSQGLHGGKCLTSFTGWSSTWGRAAPLKRPRCVPVAP